MMLRDMEIDLSIAKGRVLVDGKDLANHINAVRFDHTVGDVPTVVLSFPVVKLAAKDHGQVEVDEPTRDALIALGWTPPSGPAEPVESFEWQDGVGWVDVTPPADAA